MAGIYQLCAVRERLLLRAHSTKDIRVQGFAFSIASDHGGLREVFTSAVWGDRVGDSRWPYPTWVFHRPERVKALSRELDDVWRTERAGYATLRGDDYGDWFIGEYENVLDLFRYAAERGEWVTNNADALARALASGERAAPDHASSQAPVGIAGMVALGAVGFLRWRHRRLLSLNATTPP